MFLHSSQQLKTYLRHSKVTMKDGALRVDVQCTLEVVFGQFELLLSKVLFCFAVRDNERKKERGGDWGERCSACECSFS